MTPKMLGRRQAIQEPVAGLISSYCNDEQAAATRRLKRNSSSKRLAVQHRTSMSHWVEWHRQPRARHIPVPVE